MNRAMTGDSLPALDACVRLHATAHERFGTEPFAPDAIDDPDEGRNRTLSARLDLLVAYGLLDRTGDGRYRVRCPPDSPLDRWRDRYDERAEALYGRIAQSDGADRIAHGGAVYRSVRVADGASLDAVADAVAASAPDDGDAAGVILRSSPEFADRVQRMADDLADSAGAGGDLPARYEKEGTDLVGDHKDGLEFRLFLRRT
jgi:hypothetical protein